MNVHDLATRVIEGYRITRDDASTILATSDAETIDLLMAAYRIRRRYHGNKVRIHILMNAKSGMCPEDCSFCSQSSKATTEIDRYRLLSKEELIEGARRAKEGRAYKYCIVTSTRSPAAKELETICDAVRVIKKEIGIRICASLGRLNDEAAGQLQSAGVNRFNHNLETSERLFPSICTTHTYQDRVATIKTVQRAGMETCCGGIVGMNEADEDIVDLAFAMRELDIDSIPVNFLNSRPGTDLEGALNLSPLKCLRVLAMFRFANPSKDIRAAGGREINLRALQPLALYAVNSIFSEGYLTTGGTAINQDHQMIRDMGFEIEE
ncbi:MAG: biotin synthase BioB [Planctomycetes bacterium RBG_16_59_8]|nr:MAG: biotin synthase BioB [Planctomycetes bacterium RBG_16_59_8]